VSAAFSGFETVTVKDVRVRAGDNKQKISLPLKRVDEAVTVGRDKQSAALDPLGSSFSTVLTREQIAALPDDPDEMEAALKAMSPPGAVMRVDGFTGGKLPPKSQIRSIRLPRMDQMAAQNHGGIGGMMHIDVMTQPGNGPIAGGALAVVLERELPGLIASLADKGVLWISWPKKSAKIATDVTEDTLREIVLPLGLVDVKVCAVDAIWSALKFVRRTASAKTA